MMRVLVCGGRTYGHYSRVRDALDELHREEPITCVIQGGATGADYCGRRYAREMGIDEVEFRAEWERLGKRAGPIRNQRMLDEGMPNVVVAFPGGHGTADMVRRAKAAGVVVKEIT